MKSVIVHNMRNHPSLQYTEVVRKNENELLINTSNNNCPHLGFHHTTAMLSHLIHSTEHVQLFFLGLHFQNQPVQNDIRTCPANTGTGNEVDNQE